MLSEKHLADLHSSGLNDDIIKEMRFTTIGAAEACEKLKRKDINCECLLIPYPNAEGFFRLKPDGIIVGSNGKPAKYLQPGGAENHLYTHPKIYNELNTSDLPLLIVEGEKKAIKAAQEFYFNENLFLPICFGGVWNWRTKIPSYNKKGEYIELKGRVKDLEELAIDNRTVYICFDSDIETNEQVADAERELANYLLGRGAIRTLSIRIPSNGVNKLGIDDYLVQYGNDAFKKLIDEADSSTLVRANINLIRELPGLNYPQRVDRIVSLILKDLKLSGKFFYDNAGVYYFSTKSKKVLDVTDEDFKMQLAYSYGLYRNMSEFLSILGKLQEYANYNGLKTTVRNFSYLNKDNYSTYVYDNNGGIYKISKDVVRHSSNGLDNIYFKHRDFTSFKYCAGSKDYFQKYLLDVCNFQQNENTLLTHEQQIWLFTVWFYSLFYPNLLPTKPVLVMTGDWSSGKSTIQRVVGKLLFGSEFNVSTLESKKDFTAAVINKYYLVYDNVDIIKDVWLRNAIASLATGYKVEIRKLFSNMQMFQADPIAYLAMSSMNQTIYKRPDIASRLLIFRTKALQKKIPEGVIHDNIERNRDYILSEVFDNLALINKSLAETERFKYNGDFRMADFASLGVKISFAFGRENEFYKILDILSTEQTTLVLEDNPLIDLIDHWLRTRVNPQGVSTGELYAIFSQIAADTKLPFPFRSVTSFGMELINQTNNLQRLYHFVGQRKHGNKMIWDIGHKERQNGSS